MELLLTKRPPGFLAATNSNPFVTQTAASLHAHTMWAVLQQAKSTPLAENAIQGINIPVPQIAMAWVAPSRRCPSHLRKHVLRVGVRLRGRVPL